MREHDRPKPFCVYLVTNLVNDKKYVGWTIDLSTRWVRHRDPNSKCPALRRAIQKYGSESFTIEPIEWCEDAEDAKRAECFWIEWYETFGKHGYNMTRGGDGAVGYHHSEETKAKMASRQETDETRAKKSASAKRRAPHSVETIEKGAAKRRGQKRSPEFRAKLSAIAKSRPVEHMRRMTEISRSKSGYDSWINRLQDSTIRETLIENDGHRANTAAKLGISCAELYRRIRRSIA